MRTHWKGLTPKPDNFFGFVYIISNNIDDRKYIGKKQYWMSKPKSPKSKTTDRTSPKWNPKHWKESTWKTYTGSSKELNADIKKLGKKNFDFEIVGQYEARGSLYYGEVEWQVKLNCLTEKHKNGRYYYNKQIAAVRFIPPEARCKETEERLRKELQWKYL